MIITYLNHILRTGGDFPFSVSIQTKRFWLCKIEWQVNTPDWGFRPSYFLIPISLLSFFELEGQFSWCWYQFLMMFLLLDFSSIEPIFRRAKFIVFHHINKRHTLSGSIDSGCKLWLFMLSYYSNWLFIEMTERISNMTWRWGTTFIITIHPTTILTIMSYLHLTELLTIVNIRTFINHPHYSR